MVNSFCSPRILKAKAERLQVLDQPQPQSSFNASLDDLDSKLKWESGGCYLVVKHSLSVFKALVLILSTTKERQNKKKIEREAGAW